MGAKKFGSSLRLASEGFWSFWADVRRESAHHLTATGSAALIPMQDFFRNPARAGFKISPTGEYLAFLMPWQHRLNIHVQKIGEAKATRITTATQRDIAGYLWAKNNRLVYLQDTARR